MSDKNVPTYPDGWRIGLDLDLVVVFVRDSVDVVDFRISDRFGVGGRFRREKFLLEVAEERVVVVVVHAARVVVRWCLEDLEDQVRFNGNVIVGLSCTLA